MVIECPSCKTKFAIDAEQLAGIENPRFHCSRCNHFFELSAAELGLAPAAPAPAEEDDLSVPGEEPAAGDQAPELDEWTAGSEDFREEAFPGMDEKEPEQLELLPPQEAGTVKGSTYRMSREELENILNSADDISLVTADWPADQGEKHHEADLSQIRQTLLRSVEGEEFAQTLGKREQRSYAEEEEAIGAVAWERELPVQETEEQEPVAPDWETPEPQDQEEAEVRQVPQFGRFEEEEDEAFDEQDEQGPPSWMQAEEQPPPPGPIDFSGKMTVKTNIARLVGIRPTSESTTEEFPEESVEEIREQSYSAVPPKDEIVPPQQQMPETGENMGRLRRMMHESTFARLQRKQLERPFGATEQRASRRYDERRPSGQQLFGLQGKLALLSLLSVPIIVAGLFWIWSATFHRTPPPIKQALHADTQNLPKLAPPGLALVDIKNEVITLDNGKKVLQITGELVNGTAKTYKNIKIEAEVFNKQNQSLNKIVVGLYNGLSNARLQALTETAIEALQAKEAAGVNSLAPNAKIPFRVVVTALTGAEMYSSTKIYSVQA